MFDGRRMGTHWLEVGEEGAVMGFINAVIVDRNRMSFDWHRPTDVLKCLRAEMPFLLTRTLVSTMSIACDYLEMVFATYRLDRSSISVRLVRKFRK